MKILVFILLLVPGLLIGQEVVLHSPFTQNLESGHITSIARSIHFIDDSKVVIATHTPDGKDFYTLNILDTENVTLDGEIYTIYHCKTEDGAYPTTLVLNKNQGAPYMDILQPALENPKEVERFRFLIE